MTTFTDASLIFLISQPRAGSTMVQRVLAGHPAIHTTSEPWLMLHPVYALRPDGHEAEYGAMMAYRAVQDFLSALPGKEAVYYQALQQMALHLYGTACQQAGKTFFLDKTPRYFFVIPELATIFPQARFILLLRNPLAVLSSILRTWVQGEWIRLQRHYDNLLTAAQRLAEGIKYLGDRAYILHYESFVQRPEEETEALCQWLGLGFTPGMLAYGDRAPLLGRYGDPAGIRQYDRPTVPATQHWLSLGTERQTRHLAEAYLHALGADLIGNLGYDYGQLMQQLRSVPCGQQRIIAPWPRIFVRSPGKKDKIYLALIEFLQKRNLRHTVRQVGKIWIGRF